MFSATLSSSIRLKLWKMKPMCFLRIALRRLSRIAGDVLVEEPVVAFGRVVEQPDDVQQRRLAAAGRPHDGDEIALVDLEVDAVQGDGLDLVGAIDLEHVVELEHGYFPLVEMSVDAEISADPYRR